MAKQSFLMKRRVAIPLMLVVALGLSIGGLWLYSVVSEVGFVGFVSGLAGHQSRSTVVLKNQPVYRIKKKQELLGMNVLRIISRQQPEEFLVLDGVSRPLVDKIYGKAPDLVWANMMANQLLKLRQPGEGGTLPVSIEIQNMKTVQAGELQAPVSQGQSQPLPYWQVEVQFKLSNESEPRYYEAGIVRRFSGEEGRELKPEDAMAQDTLIIGYAQKDAFQKELIADLMSHLTFASQDERSQAAR